MRRLVWLILNFINATGIKDASMLLEVRSKEHSFRAKTSRWTSFENDQAALKLIYTLQVTIIKKKSSLSDILYSYDRLRRKPSIKAQLSTLFSKRTSNKMDIRESG